MKLKIITRIMQGLTVGFACWLLELKNLEVLAFIVFAFLISEMEVFCRK